MSYLPLKEEVGKLAKNPKIVLLAIVVLIVVAIAGGWLLYRHYDNIERANSNDVRNTGGVHSR